MDSIMGLLSLSLARYLSRISSVFNQNSVIIAMTACISSEKQSVTAVVHKSKPHQLCHSHGPLAAAIEGTVWARLPMAVRHLAVQLSSNIQKIIKQQAIDTLKQLTINNQQSILHLFFESTVTPPWQ
jgi:hypothetical protein